MGDSSTQRRRNWKNKQREGGPVYCAYCATELIDSNITVDHVVPIVAGGKHRNSNYLLSCYECNQERGKQYLKDKRSMTGRHNCFQCHQQHSCQPCPLTKRNN